MNSIKVKAQQFNKGENRNVEESVAAEELLSISINGEAYTITMRSPGDENDLVRGILLTEDIYSQREEEPDIKELHRNELGFITEVDVLIPLDHLEKGIETKRNLMSVTSCGMCGKAETQLELGPALEVKHKLNADRIFEFFQSMAQHQNLFQLSGGSHASAAFGNDAKLLAVREDIGRHNAVDKVIGSLMRSKTIEDALCLLVSGRVSYEIVSKAYKAGIPFLAAVSAPSSMAIDMCEKVGITLMAFCRGKKFTVYSHPENLVS